jgi:hypothetical protein
MGLHPIDSVENYIRNVKCLFVLAVLLGGALELFAQTNIPDAPHKTKSKPQVNWFYGAYVPKDVPLEPLTNRDRLNLYIVQTFTGPGIYVKTMFLSGADQVNVSPEEWGGGSKGFAKRIASNHAQSIIQNSLSAVGNGLLQFEPRYDLCRCEGRWRRVRHAVMRNFLTYNRTERELRPQIPLYAAAVGAGLISRTWIPHNESLASRASRGVSVQAVFGSLSNLAAEFAPDFKRLFRKRPTPSQTGVTPRPGTTKAPQ